MPERRAAWPVALVTFALCANAAISAAIAGGTGSWARWLVWGLVYLAVAVLCIRRTARPIGGWLLLFYVWCVKAALGAAWTLAAGLLTGDGSLEALASEASAVLRLAIGAAALHLKRARTPSALTQLRACMSVDACVAAVTLAILFTLAMAVLPTSWTLPFGFVLLVQLLSRLRTESGVRRAQALYAHRWKVVGVAATVMVAWLVPDSEQRLVFGSTRLESLAWLVYFYRSDRVRRVFVTGDWSDVPRPTLAARVVEA